MPPESWLSCRAHGHPEPATDLPAARPDLAGPSGRHDLHDDTHDAEATTHHHAIVDHVDVHDATHHDYDHDHQLDHDDLHGGRLQRQQRWDVAGRLERDRERWDGERL